MAYIPNLPTQQQELLEIVETPQGKKFFMHSAWHNYFSQLNTELQNNISNEGTAVPTHTTSNIVLLNKPQNQNKLLIDNQLNQAKIYINGVLKTFTLT